MDADRQQKAVNRAAARFIPALLVAILAVGGVVSETSFKYFVQFTSYASLLSIFLLIVMACAIADAKSYGFTPSVHWIVAIALAALFTSFTLGMSGTSIHLATQNLTTIENIDLVTPAASTVWATRKESMKKVDANTGDKDDDGGPPLTVLMKTPPGPRAQTF
ncbi:hypothetical protein B0A49_11731 [Cryomyces minteri]|uniref:Palmitoyltransferase n=1 Tax=Cryomyces minteri TaxID=331657 RepID=A0A4U0WYP9_9PEZI|nr:hypothetical protein B0A49_11731 [Cryomyces minteri]